MKVLQRCIHSVLNKTEYDNYEVLVVDNQNRETQSFRYHEEIKSNLKVKITKYDGPFNYSKIINYAVSLIDSKYIIFLDSHTEVISREWITAMLEHAQRKEVGIAGALLYYPNDTIQHAGVIIGIDSVAGYSHKCFPRNAFSYMNRAKTIQNLSAVTVACLMTKKDVFEEVGGVDENYSHVYDLDFCLKVKNGDI